MNEIIGRLNVIGQMFVGYAGSMLIQSCILIVLLLLAEGVLRKRVRGVFRYYLWMLVLVKLVLPTTLSFPTGLGYWVGDKISAGPKTVMVTVQPEVKKLAGQDSPAIYHKAPAAVSTVAVPRLPAVVSSTPVTWQGIVFLGWVAAIGVLTLLTIQRYFFVKGLIAQAQNATGKIMQLYNECSRTMGIAQPPVLKMSSAVASPAACGLTEPVILMPEFLPSKLTAQEMRGVLLHELAHIRRRDLWVDLIQTILQIVYFYNPLFWLANAIIRRVREQAADETAMVMSVESKDTEDHHETANQYALTLINVARVARLRPALRLRMVGVVESQKALTGRVKHILDRPIPQTAKLGFLGLAGIFLFGVILLPMACGEGKTSLVEQPVKAEKEIVSGTVPAAAPQVADSRFTVTLPDNVTVELLAVSYFPQEGKPWWKPDGSPLPEVPFGKIVIPRREYTYNRVFVYRVSGPSGAGFRSEIAGATRSGGVSVLDRNGQESREFQADLCYMLEGMRITDVSRRVSLNAWKTFATYQADETAAQEKEEGGKKVTFQPPVEKGKETILVVFENFSHQNIRVLAIDKAGQEHTATHSGGPSHGATGFTAGNYIFPVPLKDIKEFQFQTQPYHLVTFKNVSLEPGKRTEVKMIVEGQKADAENNEQLSHGSRLEFRVVPTTLNPDDAGKHAKDLRENGPEAGHKRGDEYQWFETQCDVHGGIYESYQGRKYILLHAWSPYVMIPQTQGPEAWGLKAVQPAKDNAGTPAIMAEFDGRGAMLFSNLTQRSVGSPLAMLIDGRVISAPVVRSRISDKAMITGKFTVQEVDQQVKALREGMIKP